MERDGWSLPRHFGSSQIECDAVRANVGLFDRSDHVLTSFTGPDRLSYFQGMISNDLRALTPGRGLYATVLNVQGKVLGDCRVLSSEDSYLVEWWEPIKEKILNHLNRYLVADEVEISDLSGQHGILSVQGPKAAELVGNLFPQVEMPSQPLRHSTVGFNDVEIRVLKESHTGEEGFDLLIPQAALASVAARLTELGKSFAANWIGQEAQEVLRFEAGIPRYNVDITEDHLLLETGLTHAVSFTKGCYLGQEVVERIRSRGHVNKKLCGLLLAGQEIAQRDDLIFAADKEIGILTSSVYSPTLRQPIALGYLQRDFWTAGTTVAIKRQSAAIEAKVADVPFVTSKR